MVPNCLRVYELTLLDLKEFKEDLGVTGEKKTDGDKKDIQQREDDKIGLKRDENDAKREDQSKK